MNFGQEWTQIAKIAKNILNSEKLLKLLFGIFGSIKNVGYEYLRLITQGEETYAHVVCYSAKKKVVL